MKLSSNNRRLSSQFEKAYNLYADAIFRHCYLRIGDREAAKDLMQEAFMKTWEYLSKGNDIDDVRPFLYRTAHNCLIDSARKIKRRKTNSLEDMQESGFDIEGEDGGEWQMLLDAQSVVETFQKVREPYRSVLIMRYVDGLKPNDISKLLDIPANTVSVRINRGINQLKTFLKDG